MASSSDAVRNFVYDVHLYNLKQGWTIVQQLAENEYDSWERINTAFPVKDPNGEASWDAKDEEQVEAFERACPLLGGKLAAQLAAQAAMFVGKSLPQPLQRGNSMRLGSLRERMSRLYLKESQPSALRKALANSLRTQNKDKGRLVPFAEAIDRPGFVV